MDSDASGDFDEAKQVNFQEVSPRFDLMQHELHIAIETEDKLGASCCP